MFIDSEDEDDFINVQSQTNSSFSDDSEDFDEEDRENKQEVQLDGKKRRSYSFVHEKFSESRIQQVKNQLEDGKSQGHIAKKLKITINDVKSIKRYIARGEMSNHKKFEAIRAEVAENFRLARLESRAVVKLDFETWICTAVKNHSPNKNCSSESILLQKHQTRT